MKKIKLAILGYGNVPNAVLRYMEEEAARQALKDAGVKFVITGVTTGSRGNAIDKNGISLEKLEAVGKEGKISDLNKGPATKNNLEFIAKVPADVLFVATPASVPSLEEIKAAFARGMSVVTSNKTLVANHFQELRKLAADKDVEFRYGATVLAGRNWRETIEANPDIIEIQIVVNATTNQALTSTLEEEDFEKGLKRSQEMGIAEREYIADLGGADTQKKLVIAANTAWHTDLKPKDVPTQGVVDENGKFTITVEQLRKADEAGKWIHLLGIARKTDQGIKAEVKPVEVDEPFFVGMRGTRMGIRLITPEDEIHLGLVMGEGKKAIVSTAKGVFADLLTIARSLNKKS